MYSSMRISAEWESVLGTNSSSDGVPVRGSMNSIRYGWYKALDDA